MCVHRFVHDNLNYVWPSQQDFLHWQQEEGVREFQQGDVRRLLNPRDLLRPLLYIRLDQEVVHHSIPVSLIKPDAKPLVLDKAKDQTKVCDGPKNILRALSRCKFQL